MATDLQLSFLKNVGIAAKASGHIWPAMAACEAAVETAWGTSQSFKQGRNLFGTKQHQHPVFGTVNLPTVEVVGGQPVHTLAAFIEYPTVAACFADRMATLLRLAPDYPNYAAALSADSAEAFVTAVSKSWSTAPDRAANCISILHAHGAILPPVTKDGS